MGGWLAIAGALASGDKYDGEWKNGKLDGKSFDELKQKATKEAIWLKETKKVLFEIEEKRKELKVAFKVLKETDVTEINEQIKVLHADKLSPIIKELFERVEPNEMNYIDNDSFESVYSMALSKEEALLQLKTSVQERLRKRGEG